MRLPASSNSTYRSEASSPAGSTRPVTEVRGCWQMPRVQPNISVMTAVLLILDTRNLPMMKCGNRTSGVRRDDTCVGNCDADLRPGSAPEDGRLQDYAKAAVGNCPIKDF